MQSHCVGNGNAAFDYVSGQADLAQSRRLTVLTGVAIVVGVRNDLASEDFIANNMDTMVSSGYELLKLRGAPHDMVESVRVGFAEP